jgi:hypothetical protein
MLGNASDRMFPESPTFGSLFTQERGDEAAAKLAARFAAFRATASRLAAARIERGWPTSTTSSRTPCGSHR